MGISVITCTMRDHCIDNVFENYLKQQYEQKELIIVLNGDDMQKDKWQERASKYKDVSVHALPSTTSLGECLNFAVNNCKFPYIANFEDDDYYSHDYLHDSLNLLHEVNADVVGKTSVYIYFNDKRALGVFNPNNENQWVNSQTSFGKQYLQGGTLFFKKELFEKVKFPHKIKELDRLFCQLCVLNGYKVYSGEKKGFVYIREADGSHTWKVSNDVIYQVTKLIAHTDDFTEYI